MAISLGILTQHFQTNPNHNQMAKLLPRFSQGIFSHQSCYGRSNRFQHSREVLQHRCWWTLDGLSKRGEICPKNNWDQDGCTVLGSMGENVSKTKKKGFKNPFDGDSMGLNDI